MSDWVDFGKTARDYGRHRVGFPETFYERLSGHGIGRVGQRLLDIGTGTGTLARGFVRAGCIVTGLDKSAELIAEARRLDGEAGVSTEYVLGSAESTGLGDESFDVVTAGTCWHWFDRARAAAEARRVLVPGGALVIAHFDWVTVPGNVVARTEELIAAHNARWKADNEGWAFGGGAGIYPQWLRDVAIAGFRSIETFSFDVPISYTHEGWRGRIRASAGVGASLSPEAVARFDVDLARVLAESFPDDPLAIPHRAWAVVCRAPRREETSR